MSGDLLPDDDSPSVPIIPDKFNVYRAVMEAIFFDHFRADSTEVVFERDDIIQVAARLNLKVPKNVGDVVYAVRYRGALPDKVRDAAPKNHEWALFPAGRSVYAFRPVKRSLVEPTKGLARTKLPDATPGIITRNAKTDEQALLAKLRYNRLIDIFTRVTCYSLQNHLRTSIPVQNPLKPAGSKAETVQVETDEIYVGVDKRGAQFVVPVQAKGGNDALSVVQIWQDIELCWSQYPGLAPRPVAAQFIEEGGQQIIALFEFEAGADAYDILVSSEQHYVLVPPEAITESDLRLYQRRKLD